MKALNAKNKVGIIDGTIQRPDDDDQKFQAWKRCNNMVLSWLLIQSLRKSLQVSSSSKLLRRCGMT